MKVQITWPADGVPGAAAGHPWSPPA